MKAYLYARVSTVDKEQDPRPQLGEMIAYCRQRQWEWEEFSEKVSAGKSRRPEYERMLAQLRRGLAGAVICRHFDRIARSARELVLLAEELEGLNVNFVSLNQAVDTTTPMGKFCFTILAAAAELERSMIRERVKLGLAAARAKGRIGGRPRVAVDRDKVALWRRSGASWRTIAGRLGISPATALRSLEGRSKTVSKTSVQNRGRK